MDINEPWVNAEQAAEHLGVKKHSIYRWIDDKEFPSHRVGRLLRFKLSEVDNWVRKEDRRRSCKSVKGDHHGI